MLLISRAQLSVDTFATKGLFVSGRLSVCECDPQPQARAVAYID